MCPAPLPIDTQFWNINALIAFFTVFNAWPTVVELTTLFFVSKFSFVSL